MNKPETPKTPLPRDGNAFFEEWTTPDGVPPFDRIGPGAVPPGLCPGAGRARGRDRGHCRQIPQPPTFDNTIAAMELSGRALDRVGNVFHLLAGAHSNDALLEIEREMSPQLARHWNAINTNAALFRASRR